MRLVQGISKRTWKMDCCVWQKTRGLYFLQPWRQLFSSDERPANEPSAEKLDCRGGARPQEVWHRIFTTDKGSPHLEWHRRYRDGPGALGPREDRVHSALLTHRQKVRPDRNFSSLRYLISAHIQGRSHRHGLRSSPPVLIVRNTSISRPSSDATAGLVRATCGLVHRKHTNAALPTSTARPAPSVFPWRLISACVGRAEAFSANSFTSNTLYWPSSSSMSHTA